MGKITVIVPAYNAGPHISRCVESILGQTYHDLQIILVDDGSTDGTGELCDRYAKSDGRVEACHTENKGLVAARKLGLRRAVGEYTGFVDADDYVEPDMFELLWNEIRESGADFVHMGYIEENCGRSEAIYGFRERTLDLPDMGSREDTLAQYVFRPEGDRFISPSIWSKLFRRELIQKCYAALPDEQQYGEDLLCLCLCILESRRIRLSRHARYHYAIQGESLSHLHNMEWAVAEAGLQYHLLKLLRDYDPSVYLKLQGHICRFLVGREISMIKSLGIKDLNISEFYYKNAGDLRGRKIVLYGAGKVGQDYYLQFCRYRDIDIVAWLDSGWQGYRFDYAGVRGISELDSCECDRIVIAVWREDTAREIEKMLMGRGQGKEKICWEVPGRVLDKEKISHG